MVLSCRLSGSVDWLRDDHNGPVIVHLYLYAHTACRSRHHQPGANLSPNAGLEYRHDHHRPFRRIDRGSNSNQRDATVGILSPRLQLDRHPALLSDSDHPHPHSVGQTARQDDGQTSLVLDRLLALLLSAATSHHLRSLVGRPSCVPSDHHAHHSALHRRRRPQSTSVKVSDDVAFGPEKLGVCAYLVQEFGWVEFSIQFSVKTFHRWY